MRWINLAAGSLLGGFSRYFLTGMTLRFVGSEFPFGTLLVNLSGCFMIGFFNALAEYKFALNMEERMLWMTGFCGAFTTFSTFILETSNLSRNGEFARAVLNVALSVLLGFFLFRAGEFVGKGMMNITFSS